MSRANALRATVLYCHGLGATSTSGIAKEVKKLVESKQLLFKSVQYRDTGNIKRLWSVDRWLEDLLTAIDANNKEPIILLGCSAGCHSVLRATLLRQERVMGLVLLSPGVGLSFESYAQIVLPHAISDLLSGKSVLHPAATSGVPALVNLECLQRFVESCICNSMHRIPINCPVRIMHGEDDKVVPLRNIDTFVKKLESKDITVEVLRGVGHHIPMTKKFEAMFDSLLDVLSTRTNRADNRAPLCASEP